MSAFPALAQQRVRELGSLGKACQLYIVSEESRSVFFSQFVSLPYTSQILSLGKLVSENNSFFAAICSILGAEFPVQIELDDNGLKKLVYGAFTGDFDVINFYYSAIMSNRSEVMSEGLVRIRGASKGKWFRMQQWVAFGEKVIQSKELRMEYLPLKTSHPGATNKVNVWSKEVVAAAKEYYRRPVDEALGLLGSLKPGSFNDDQFSAGLMHACGLKEHTDICLVGLISILCPGQAKALSTTIKSLGCSGSSLGAKLVEMNTLQGRGVGPLDLLAEAKYRCDKEKVKESCAHFDMGRLEAAVREILREELDEKPEYMLLAEHWERRWEWCVNGSHAKLLERLKPQYKTRDIPGVNNWYRRMFAESVEREPVSTWDGDIVVSASPKLEHGKVRAIFACDSLSYFAFEHFLAPIEKVWAGKRVILDPGSLGHYGMAQRVLEARSNGEVSVMLDYDDFNSQHTLESQAMVIRVVAEHVGYDRKLAEKLVESFYKMRIYCAGAYVGTAAGTLMSGHRATTFLNTILNSAYIRVGIGESVYRSCTSMHVGDDVYMSCRTYADASKVLSGMRSTECRLNPTKQSVGSVTAEFLRVAITNTYAVGYYARCVSSIVSGNWVGDVKLSPLEALQTMVQSSRTLINRGGDYYLHTLLIRSVVRMTGLSENVVVPFLSGRVALGSGPQFISAGSRLRMDVDVIKYIDPAEEQKDKTFLASCPEAATVDYLTNVASPVERFAMQMLRTSVKSAMKSASFRREVSSGTPDVVQHLVPRSLESYTPFGSVDVRTAHKRKPVVGCLSKYPLLALVKNMMTPREVRELVQCVGGNAAAPNISLEAWGSEYDGVVVLGVMSYTDAASYGKRVAEGVLYTDYQCYV